MNRQVGDLVLDGSGMARRGLILRHLIMPGLLEETEAILRFVADELGTGTYVNLMAQYHVAGKVGQNGKYEEIARGIHREEYEQTLALARELGLRLDPRVLGRRSDERANRGVSFWSSSGFEKEAVMADTVRRVEYYYVTVPDVPGEGQRILSALKDDGVNLLAFLGFPLGGGQSQIDLVPEDPRSLSEAAERAGVTLSEAKRAFLIQGDDRVGAVAETMAKLAQASINLTAAAATGAGAGRYGMILWVAPADYERAAAALGAQ